MYNYPSNLQNRSSFLSFFKGNYHLALLKSQYCVDLAKEWQNRASSLVVNKCIVVYTTSNCKSSKETQIFANANEKYFDINSSKPNNIPSFSFYGSS